MNPPSFQSPLPHHSHPRALLRLLLVLAAIFAAGCGAAPTATPTPQPTATSVPTPTIVPSPTQVSLADLVGQGDALRAQSDYAGAEAAYQQALQRDASFAPAHAALARLWDFQLGREKDELAEAQKAVELAASDPVAHAVLARAHLTRWSLDEALQAAEKAVTLDEKNAYAQATLAEALLFNREDEDALKAAESAVALDPDMAQAYYDLALVYEQTGDFGRSLAARQKALALEPDFAPWHVGLAYWHLVRDQPDQAQAEYQRALELAPKDAVATLGLADVALFHRRYEEAEQLVQSVIDALPEVSAGYVHLGRVYLRQDKADDALAQFRKALLKNDKDWSAQMGIASTHLHEQECDSAARQAQELMTLQPVFADGRVDMGLARLCSGDNTKALEYFRKALEQEPQNADAHLGLGIAFAAQERWEEATASMVQALRWSAGRAVVHAYSSRLYVAQGDAEGAKAEGRTALALNPEELDGHLVLAEVSAAEGKHAECQTHAQAALKLDPKDADALRWLGSALLAQDQAKEALPYLEQLVEQEPDDALGQLYLGLAYRDLGRYSDAKKRIETCLALEPEQVSTQQLQILVDFLGKGYTLTEDKAIADLDEGLDGMLDTRVDVGIEDVGGAGRTLVASLAVEADAEQSDIASLMGMAIGASATYLPRITPPVKNGVLVRAKQDGGVVYTLGMDLLDARRLGDGTLSQSELVSRLHFARVGKQGTTDLAQVQEALAKLRELEPKRDVVARMITRDDLSKLLEERADPDQEESIRRSDALFTVLGVLDPQVDLGELLQELQTEQIAGFYDDEKEELYVVQSQEQSASDQATLAHEYAHALQDQWFGLEELHDELADGDQRLAFRALAEGDATLSMLLYSDEHIALFDILQALSSASGMQQEALEASPGMIRGLEMFPYESGPSFVAAMYSSGGWDAVDEAYSAPPLSTEQVLHPERYREEDAPQKVTLPDLAGKLGGDWRLLESDVMGELGLRLWLADDMAPAAASLAAEGWGGDRYALLQRGNDGPYAFVLQSVWDDQDEADEFWALMNVSMEHRSDYQQDVKELVGKLSTRWYRSNQDVLRVRQDGRNISVIVAPDEATIARIDA